MFISVSSCLHSKESKFQNLQPMKDALDELDNRIIRLSEYHQHLETDSKCYALEKRATREKMAHLADAMRKKLQAVALAHNDDQSYHNNNVTASVFLYEASLTSHSCARGRR